MSPDDKAYRVTGELWMADLDLERGPVIPTFHVDVVLIGDEHTVELLVNLLNSGCDGWVDAVEIPPPDGD